MGRDTVQTEGIHHVAVIASDYAISRHFYTQVLRLSMISEHFREARKSWKLDLRLPDGTRIELFSFPSSPPRPSWPEACGLRHLALGVKDFDAALQYLSAHAIQAEPVRIDEFTGCRFSFIADPDGTPLELYESGAKAVADAESWNSAVLPELGG
jgi:glyoxylase I family protein